jgi:hypothetical protein
MLVCQNNETENFKLKCSACLANVPDGYDKCPKCGSSVFFEADEDGPLRRALQFFSSPTPFYVKAKPPLIMNGELAKFETEWKLYRVRLLQNAPSIFIWDRDGYLPGKQEAALHLVEGEDLAVILSSLPSRKKEELKHILRDEWCVDIKKDDELAEALMSRVPLIFQPVPKLRDPSVLEGMDWENYVQILACPKPGKDPKLVKVHLAKLLCPINMQYAPHSLEVANSNTGKTRFYDAAGIKIDKATRRAVLGFAKSPVEVYPGTINGTALPTAFDQIESQDSYELAKYMLDILETGRALVDSGGVRFVVETGSSFAYIGNPVAKDAKVIEGFKTLLTHICANPAMGRRFGIILFSTNLKTIQGGEKMTPQELEEWKRSFILFRAVEEYAQPRLREIMHKIVGWLHTPIKGYRETIYRAVEELEDYNLAAFFESHAEAEHRVRGAALHAAIALMLDKIALGKATVEDIIAKAEDLLNDYVKINLDSIAMLCRMWDKLRADQAKTYFENLSDYLKEIVSACILYRKHKPDAVSIQLDQIPYEPENKTTYTHFSKCIDRLKRRKRFDDLNEALKSFFGFQIANNDGNFVVEYFEAPKAPDDLKIIGFLNFSDFSISQSPQTHPTNEQRELNAENVEDEEESKGVDVSENIEKLRKLRNGEKWMEKLSEATAETCVKWRTKDCPAAVPSAIFPDAKCPQTCPAYELKKEGG